MGSSSSTPTSGSSGVGIVRTVGYWGSWSVYRDGKGKFNCSHIDAKLFTHLIYAFVGVKNDGEIVCGDDDAVRIQNFVTDMKKCNSNCKMMVAVGGDNNSSTLSHVAANSRSNFSRSAVQFLKNYRLDGMDIDWEFPQTQADKLNFSKLLDEVSAAFRTSGHILSVAVGPTQSHINKSYDVPAISRNADFINLMTYDLHGAWDKKTGSNANLYGPEPNVDDCIKCWVDSGAKRNKLVVGLATYGKTFTLKDPSNNGMNAPTIGTGKAGQYSKEAGMLTYYEIRANSWKEFWEDEQKVPYASNGDQWVSYDNVKSMEIKAQFIKNRNLGGAMFWSIESDDFLGTYGQGKNPLITAVSNIIL